ncbi:MAG: family 78 glycoside hydrolase catalytic domain [Lachnospiraceae bacterium]|nr:family 78 glycoside hydrolase catalytic domain [Lachnospiraceae bacterium]
MKAIRLKVSDLIHPLGIDDRNPRFSWNCEGGITQTAYRFLAESEDGQILFDTGRVESSSMYCIYDGKALKSRMRVRFMVCLWDETGESVWSEPSFFEMGLLEPSDWQASWIHGRDTDSREHLPADCYRKEVRISEKVKRARLYVTALGVYTASVNGVRVSSVLAPGSTEYGKRLYYQTYDITDLLVPGETCRLDFSVADGWYKGKLGADQIDCLFGTQTKLLAQAEIEYVSGLCETIGTDSSFSWSNDGPVRFADLKDGEIVDARMTPSLSEQAVEDPHEKRIPTASNAPVVREHEIFAAKLLISPSGQKILDFGQNMAGYVKFRTAAPAGTQIRIRMFEALDHGEYSNTSLSFPDGNVEPVRQEILYTASGREDEYAPSFFYSGFRYALIEGLEAVDPEQFTAAAVYSDLSFGGSFTCSNPLVNQFVQNTIWSMKSNFVDVPTDCPQREKSGWTGDAQVFCRTAEYFADTKAFFRKWLRDVRDCQRDNGMVLNVNPHVLPEDSPMDAVNGSCGWADAAVILPYTLWKMTGDERFIRENYELMHGFKQYTTELCKNKSLFHLTEDNPFYVMKPLYDAFALPESEWNRYIPEFGIHWGEWSVPQSEEPEEMDPASALMRPKQEVTCAYTHYSMQMLSEMLTAIGKEEEAAECREYADGSSRAYHEHWIKEGTVQTDHMAELVRPIALGLASEAEKKNISALLNKMVIRRDYKVGTGFLSTPFLLQTLADNGYTESAYRMLEQEESPGWLAMAANGATTIWEGYDCYDEEGHPLPRSFNHYSLGAACSFLFDTVCGIRIKGENAFIIRPHPGGTLQHAEARTVTAYGEVISSWTREGDRIRCTISVPANTSAEVILPDGSQKTIRSGKEDLYFLP